MKPFESGIRTFTIAAAAALLTACGGNGSDPTSPSTVSKDDADSATRTQVAAIITGVQASSRERGFAEASDGSSVDPLAEKSGESRPGLFPGVSQTNLVANKPGFGASIVDPDLKNPWGIAIRPAGLGGHFWFAAAGSGKSIQYVGDVGDTPLFQDELKVVDTGGPATGVAFNPGKQFVITQQHPNGAITGPTKFFFANLTGTITAWTERARPQGGFDHPADSVTVVDGTARQSSFLGVAVAPAADRMFAADFGADAELRTYDGQFVEGEPLANPFRPDGRKEPGGFEAFNVQTLGERVFAMYGRHVPRDPTKPPPAEGRLAEFDGEGRLVARWYGRGYLNYPWGVAMAPKDFGLYSGCLLVGNFGDGTVVAFHPRLRVALDYVRDDHGRRVVLDGLWGLQFGNGASLGEANDLYFAAGPNQEADGLVGKLEANARTLPYLGGLSLCR